MRERLEFGPAIEGVRLAAHFDKEQYGRDGAVPVVLVITNHSPHPVRVVDSVPHGDFTLIVKDTEGPVPPTRLLVSILDYMESSARQIGRDIPSGSSVTAEVDLRLLFDLTIIGLYTVQAKRWVYIGREQRELESTTVHFEMFDQL